MNEKIEIYKERYETFRHLDKLRWQMLQIGVGAGSAVLVFGNDGSKLAWWVWITVGIILLLSGLAMIKIGSGIRYNGKILGEIGKAIGDKDIPAPSNKKSLSFLIATIMVLVGIGCITVPLIPKIPYAILALKKI